MTLYTASDYAGLSAGAVNFYFGYEQTMFDEWCFVAKEHGKETLRLPQSKLGVRDRWDVTENLLAGIGLWLERTHAASSRTSTEGK